MGALVAGSNPVAPTKILNETGEFDPPSLARDKAETYSAVMVKQIGSVKLRKPGRWMIDLRPWARIYSLGGVPFDGNSGNVVASAVLSAIRLAVERGASPEEAVAPYIGRPASSLIQNAFARFVEHFETLVRSGDRSEKTLREYQRIGRDEIPRWGDLSVREITFAALSDWSVEMALRGLSPKSRRNYLGALRACLGWLIVRNELSAIPPFPSVPVPEYLPTVLPKSIVDLILSNIEESRRGPFLVAARMGLRPGEVRALDVADVDRSGSPWRLRVSKAIQTAGSEGTVGPTKNRRERVLPIHPDLRDWMNANVDWTGRLQRKPLFTLPRSGKRLSHGAMVKIWKRASKGITDASLYEGTKHSFASDALNRMNIPIERVQKFLGHADLRSTERYARLADDALDVFLEG